MMTFLDPLNALIPKIPFSFFCRFFGSASPPRPGVSLGRIWGVPSIEPLLGGARSSQGALLTPPPLPIESPPAQGMLPPPPPPPAPTGCAWVGGAGMASIHWSAPPLCCATTAGRGGRMGGAGGGGGTRPLQNGAGQGRGTGRGIGC